VQALDARTGELIWENRIGPVSSIAYGGTRSLAVYHDKVYVATTDAMIHALDARTGKIVWEQALGTPNNSNTGGVMVMRGKVLTGLTGCDNYSRTIAISRLSTPTPASRPGASTPPRWKASRAAIPGTACPTCCAAAPTPGSRAPTIPT
jgi:outer membrane protein assembly factor BamB